MLLQCIQRLQCDISVTSAHVEVHILICFKKWYLVYVKIFCGIIIMVQLLCLFGWWSVRVLDVFCLEICLDYEGIKIRLWRECIYRWMVYYYCYYIEAVLPLFFIYVLHGGTHKPNLQWPLSFASLPIYYLAIARYLTS